MITDRLRVLLQSGRLSEENKSQLRDLIKQIDSEQAILQAKVNNLYKVFSNRQSPLDLSRLSPKDPEHVAIALHKVPELCLAGKMDINICRWWSVLALCEKYTQMLVSHVDVARLRLSMASILSDKTARGYPKRSDAIRRAIELRSRFKKVGIDL